MPIPSMSELFMQLGLESDCNPPIFRSSYS